MSDLLPFIPPPSRPHTAATNRGWSHAEVLHNMGIGIIIIDESEQQIVFRNPATFDILQDAGAPWTLADLQTRLMEQGALCGFEVLAGSTLSFPIGNRLIGCSVHIVSPGHYSLILRDVTEKIRLESIAQAVNTMDNIGFIFSGIRHEIGNPLNSIKMTISVLRKNLDQFSREALGEYIERTYAEVLRMEYLLKSLKNFSLFEQLDIGCHELGAFLDKFFALVQNDFAKQGITLERHTPPEAIWVEFDPRALHQALLNLLTNAADALTGRPWPRITITLRCVDRLVLLSVEDNGCGMNEEQQKLLFQPFCTTKVKGNGLGLVITQKLLAKMSSSIDIVSAEGSGTAVHIALPATDPPDATECT
jgi:signal transduction histidine kinase